jgi:hypothetical protein
MYQMEIGRHTSTWTLLGIEQDCFAEFSNAAGLNSKTPDDLPE